MTPTLPPTDLVVERFPFPLRDKVRKIKEIIRQREKGENDIKHYEDAANIFVDIVKWVKKQCEALDEKYAVDGYKPTNELYSYLRTFQITNTFPIPTGLRFCMFSVYQQVRIRGFKDGSGEIVANLNFVAASTLFERLESIGKESASALQPSQREQHFNDIMALKNVPLENVVRVYPNDAEREAHVNQMLADIRAGR